MAMCQHFKNEYEGLYRALGPIHESIMNKPTDGQKKIAALNAKNFLAIFTVELDKVIYPNQQPPPEQQQPVENPNPLDVLVPDHHMDPVLP